MLERGDEMKTILTERVTNNNGDAMFVFYEIGKFTTPLFILTESQAEQLSMNIKFQIEGEKS